MINVSAEASCYYRLFQYQWVHPLDDVILAQSLSYSIRGSLTALVLGQRFHGAVPGPVKVQELHRPAGDAAPLLTIVTSSHHHNYT